MSSDSRQPASSQSISEEIKSLHPDFPSFLEAFQGQGAVARYWLLQYIRLFRPSSKINQESTLSKRNIEIMEGLISRKAGLLEESAKKESAQDFIAGRGRGVPGFSNYTQEPLKELEAQSTPKKPLALVATLPDSADDALFQFVAHLEKEMIAGDGKGDNFEGLLSRSEVAFQQESDEGLEFYRSKIEEHRYRYGAKKASDHIVILNPAQKRWLEQQKSELYNADTCELCEVEVLAPESMPEGRGLIITPDEVTLIISPDSEWNIDISQDSKIVLHCEAGIIVEQDAISVLGNLNS